MGFRSENESAAPESGQTAYERAERRRRRLLPRAILVGVGSGLIAAAFHGSLRFAEGLRDNLVAATQDWGGAGMLLVAGIAAVGIALAVGLVRWICPEAAGSGIPHVRTLSLGLRDLTWYVLLPVKFASGLLGTGLGLALGREGPTIQMGAAIGRAQDFFGTQAREDRQALITAGAAAGLAAAFNAPLAALIFALEELRERTTTTAFFSVFVASLSADIVIRFIFGMQPVFVIPMGLKIPLETLPYLVGLGALAALVGVFFNRGLLMARTATLHRSESFHLGFALVIGALVGGLAWWQPALVGSGDRLLHWVTKGSLPVLILLAIGLARFGLTIASYTTGVAGGIFTPLLVLGAVLGSVVAQFVELVRPMGDHGVEAFAILGMVGVLVGSVRAPLTGIVLLIELTGDYRLALPAAIVSFTACLLADALHNLPIYEALFEDDPVVRAATSGGG